MNPCNGWVYTAGPDEPEKRRPMNADELLAHQRECEACRDPWFANPKEAS